MIRKSIDVSVGTESGRPIAMLVQVASKYQSKINICQGTKTVNAKSIMGMMTLGLTSGQQLEIAVDGEDEDMAMVSILQENKEKILSGARFGVAPFFEGKAQQWMSQVG